MTTDQILCDIEEGKVAPFYFLYGSESFYRVEIVQALNRKLITPNNRDFNLENFEAWKTSAGDWIGAKPFLVKKALQYTKNFNLATLRNGTKCLFEADRALKTSGKDPQGILESLLLRLCSS